MSDGRWTAFGPSPERGKREPERAGRRSELELWRAYASICVVIKSVTVVPSPRSPPWSIRVLPDVPDLPVLPDLSDLSLTLCTATADGSLPMTRSQAACSGVEAWTIDNWQWAMGNGQWTKSATTKTLLRQRQHCPSHGSGERTADCGQRAADSGQTREGHGTRVLVCL